jgi:hypothetical protein
MRQHFSFEAGKRMLFQALKTQSLLDRTAVALLGFLISRRVLNFV